MQFYQTSSNQVSHVFAYQLTFAQEMGKISWGHPAKATATGGGAPGVLRRAGAGTQRWAMLGHGGHDGHGGHPQVITIDGIPTIVMLGL